MATALLAAALALRDRVYLRSIVQRTVPVFDRLPQHGACCNKGSRFWRFKSRNGEHVTSRSCIHLCRADPVCSFFSHSTHYKNCVTCTGGCELNSTRHGKLTYLSWRRRNETRDVEVTYSEHDDPADRTAYTSNTSALPANLQKVWALADNGGAEAVAQLTDEQDRTLLSAMKKMGWGWEMPTSIKTNGIIKTLLRIAPFKHEPVRAPYFWLRLLHEQFSLAAFTRSLANKSLLFYGPAATDCSFDLCSFDVIFTTNRMATHVPEHPCYRLVLIVNNAFSTSLANLYLDINGSRSGGGEALAGDSTMAAGGLHRKFWAVLCTSSQACQRLDDLGMHRRLFVMKTPHLSHKRLPNALQYLLKYLTHVHFRRFHITGVTFYASGTQYAFADYKGNRVSSRHGQEESRNYTMLWLAERRGRQQNVTIDYPSCDALEAERFMMIYRLKFHRLAQHFANQGHNGSRFFLRDAENAVSPPNFDSPSSHHRPIVKPIKKPSIAKESMMEELGRLKSELKEAKGREEALQGVIARWMMDSRSSRAP